MMDITPEMAEICGIHAGDGYMRFRERNKGEVDISGHVEEKSYYDNHVIPLFNKVFDLEIKGRYFSRGSYGFVTHNRKVRETFRELGFQSGRKSLRVKVPGQILNSKNKLMYCRFLRGLLDTDGHVGFRKYYGKYSEFKRTKHHYPLITLTTISKFLCGDVCSMLEKLKMKYSIYDYQPKDPRDKYKYVIYINGVKRMEKWMKFIGSKNPVKLTRYLIWKKFGFCPTHTSLGQREDILNGKLDINNVGL